MCSLLAWLDLSPPGIESSRKSPFSPTQSHCETSMVYRNKAERQTSARMSRLRSPLVNLRKAYDTLEKSLVSGFLLVRAKPPDSCDHNPQPWFRCQNPVKNHGPFHPQSHKSLFFYFSLAIFFIYSSNGITLSLFPVSPLGNPLYHPSSPCFCDSVGNLSSLHSTKDLSSR